MPHFATSHFLIWTIAAASIALMLIRPRGLPEAVWTTAGALSLCALRLIPLPLAGHAVAEGLDVYLFLTGFPRFIVITPRRPLAIPTSSPVRPVRKHMHIDSYSLRGSCCLP